MVHGTGGTVSVVSTNGLMTDFDNTVVPPLRRRDVPQRATPECKRRHRDDPVGGATGLR